jgi:nucleotide-binding universal stress UspA family protein
MDKEKDVILVTWDFSPISENALLHALRIIKHVENRIRLFHVVSTQDELQGAEEKMKTICEERSKQHNLPLEYVVQVGKIFDMISSYASEKSNKINFCILGTHGMKGVQKFFGSKALRVITGSSVPFIVIKQPPSKERYTDIVFPIDFKSENKEKLQWAIFLGKYFNSKIHLYKAPVADKNLQKKVNVNLNFAIRFLIQNNIEYEIHAAASSKNFTKDTLAFTKQIGADMIIITTTKNMTMMDLMFGAKEQYLMANDEGVPIMCINPKSNFAKVGQFMYG